MTHSNKSISPLRQRMIDDMTLRMLKPKTQATYLRAVLRFTRFFGRSPDLASSEDLRTFQLHLVEQDVSSTTINATITGLKFFFGVSLERASALKRMSRVHKPQKLPQVLSVEEVERLLAGASNPKHRAALAVAYGTGLRASEVVHLKITDIDSERMIVRVEQGKGQRDRYAMLSPSLLELLRAWWRQGHAQGKMVKGGWLFPGINPVNPLSTRQLNHACHLAALLPHSGNPPISNYLMASTRPHTRPLLNQIKARDPHGNRRERVNPRNDSLNPHSTVATTELISPRPRGFLP